MKVLLINQNPVIKKLVGMASKKLNLEIENVARIAPDFNANDYICIIVDDENVGKNLERLTALQDQVKVCLLFARKTQIKKHEFNIAIQKPFLPTDILEILNDCIPKEGEIKKQSDIGLSEDVDNHSTLDYGSINSVNEIDMDLKSAEITPPEGIESINNIQEEAMQIANEDTDSMLDFNPDSLDFSSLEEAGEVTSEIPHEDTADNIDQIDEKDMQAIADQDSHEAQETRVGSIFDSDLSDLKPSSDNPLDLANFDLDSIMDSSALKAASLGMPSQIEEEAKEVADNLDDEDDLFLSDDERDLLQPSPKKFLQARQEEEERKAKEAEENINKEQADLLETDSNAAPKEHEYLIDEVQGDNTEIATQNAKNPLQDTNDNVSNNVSLESQVITDSIDPEQNSQDTHTIDSVPLDNTPNSTIQDITLINKDNLEEMGLADVDLGNLDLESPAIDDKTTKEHIDTIDLSGLDETLKKQEVQDDNTTSGTLDDAFDDLSAALDSAFNNLSFDTQLDDVQAQDELVMADSTQEDNAPLQDNAKELEIDELATLDIGGIENIDNETDPTQTMAIPSQIDETQSQSTSLDDDLESMLLESTHLDSSITTPDTLDLKHDNESKEIALDENDMDSINILDDTLHEHLESNTKDLQAELTLDELKNAKIGLDEVESNSNDLESSLHADIQDPQEKLDIDLESILDTNDLESMDTLSLDGQETTPQEDSIQKPTILAEDTLAEVNEALRAINDDALIDMPNDTAIDNQKIINTDEETKLDDDINMLLDMPLDIDMQESSLDNQASSIDNVSQENEEKHDNMLDGLLNTSLDSANSLDLDGHDVALDLDIDTIANKDDMLTEQLTMQDKETTLQDSNALDDMLADIDTALEENTESIPLDSEESDNLFIQDSVNKIAESEATIPHSDEMLYVTLPSSEESIENITETELAEALGESCDVPIIRLEQSLEEEAKQDNRQLDIAESIPLNTDDMPLDNTQTQIPQEDDAQEHVDSIRDTQHIKDLDADSLIDFFKNTPKEKLHEIFDGSEINFSIHFGKNKA